jgi:REP element-mobilizing transposase RayT
MRYRRSKTPGAAYFFTVVTYRRRRFLCEPENVQLLRSAFRAVKQRHPLSIDVFVLLPDHLHCLWTLPADDDDCSTRWMLVKSHFTRRCSVARKLPPSKSLRHKRQQTIWQGRYMEIILNGKATLAERFAEVDIDQVRKPFVEEQKVTQKYPKRMAQVFKITHLPRRLGMILPKKAFSS